MDAFDTDVLVFAAAGDERGEAVRGLAREAQAVGTRLGVGSALLLPESLIKPTRLADDVQRVALEELIAQLVIHPCDGATASVAVYLGARYRLRTADAIHLATAVRAGADRFITNNRRDFSKDIDEIAITYPEDLEQPAA